MVTRMEHQDETALKEEMIALIPRLRRFALGLTGNLAQADDVVQTALERALSRLHQFKPGTRLDSWLFRIVQTSWIDACRKASRREEGVEMGTLERLSGGSMADVTASELRRDIDAAMSQLNEEQRALVMLILVEGYSYQEASEALGIPVGTVMSRLARARKAMMSQLGGREAQA